MAARELTNEKIRNEYGLFIALGIFALLLLGIFEWVGWLSGGWALLLKIAVPLLIMALYWFRYLDMRTGHQFEYEFADSFYYMGFAFTLSALLFSFLAIGTSNEEIDTIALLGNLGIALSTTIFGLMVRVFYISFEPSSESTMDQLNKDLQASSTLLRIAAEGAAEGITNVIEKDISGLTQKIGALGADVERTTDPIKNFTSTVASAEAEAQSLADSLTQIATAVVVFSKGASDSGAALEENAEKVRDLDQAFAALEQTVSGADRDFGEHARSKQADIADIENRMSEMSLVLSRANEVASLELDKFNAALSGFTKIVNQDSAEYGTLMSSFSQVAKESSSVASALALFEKSVTDSGDAVRSTSEIAKTLAQVENDLKVIEGKHYEKDYAENIALLKASSDKLAAEMRKVGALGVDIEKYIGTSSKLINSVERHLVQNLRTLNDRIS